MRDPEEWPSCRSNPADRIRLTGPAAFKIGRWLFVLGRWQNRSPPRSQREQKPVLDFSSSGAGFGPRRTTNNVLLIINFALWRKSMSAPSRRPEIRRRRTRNEKIVKL